MHRDIVPRIPCQDFASGDSLCWRSIIRSELSSAQHPQTPPGLVITIDGPAGVGKSTVARQLATRLGYHYLDTGALYRAVAWKVHGSGIAAADDSALANLLAVTTITMEASALRPRVFVDGRDVTAEIRSPETSRLASVVSAIPMVRKWLLPVQRAVVPEGGVVAEGRDLGTVVFPTADLKFFLEADPDVRAGRRHQELVATGHERSLAQTSQEIAARDARDRAREVAPLIRPPDAEVIDTTTLGISQVVDRMMAIIATRP